MQCYCNSKHLYKSDYCDPKQTFNVDGKEEKRMRKINYEQITQTHQNQQLAQKIKETSELWMPTQIERVSWDEVAFNPFWFYQKYISKNIPVVVTDILEGDDIFDRWAEPQYLQEATEGQQQSVSLTPDGFADSIRGDYFIEPYEQKMTLKQFFKHDELYPSAVPYIQHQNSNLNKQFDSLNCQISQDTLKTISNSFFKGKQPDAQNIWIGFDKSVSSLHKDPYQNFYMSIVGEKHFTLLPPHSILQLEQQQYKSSRWLYNSKIIDGNSFTCISDPQIKNRWICQNPDLIEDIQKFPYLQDIQKFHVILQKSEMLYLPSLWYHQVSQCRINSPYTLAVNYWFDMEFSQNFSLYETCRAIRGLDK